MPRHNANYITKQFLLNNVTQDNTTNCLNWNLYVSKTIGYGTISHRNKLKLIHRISYLLFKGKIPKNMCVLHTCDNRKCINPDHLFIGTKGDNNRDRANKNRSIKGEKHPIAKLTDSLALEIYYSPLSSREAAKYYGISATLVKNIRRKTAWRHIHGN